MKSRWMFATAVFVLALPDARVTAQSSGSFKLQRGHDRVHRHSAGLLGGGTTVTSINHGPMERCPAAAAVGPWFVPGNPFGVTGLLDERGRFSGKLGDALQQPGSPRRRCRVVNPLLRFDAWRDPSRLRRSLHADQHEPVRTALRLH